MTISHQDAIRDKVQALLGDVGPLHTVSGVGFEEPEAARAERALGRLRTGGNWTTIDLRRAPAGEAAAEIRARAAKDPVLVFVARPNDAPAALLHLVRAVVDRAASVDLGDRRPALARRQDQSVVLVLEGCPDLEGVSKDLTIIPYWDFVG